MSTTSQPCATPERGPGRIRFARWDGGKLNTAKGILSGWPHFSPPDPNFLESMMNWYQPETIRLSIGIEHVCDIIEDIDQALGSACSRHKRLEAAE